MVTGCPLFVRAVSSTAVGGGAKTVTLTVAVELPFGVDIVYWNVSCPT